jgi:hypothetical protein
MTTHRRSASLALAALALAGCADPGPAAERGYFGGLGAMATGQDERQAQTMEGRAAAEHRRALEARAAAQAAAARRDDSAATLRAAQARLAALDADLTRQRQTLARLGTERGAAGRAEAARLRREADALARARDEAAARNGGPSAADLDQLERLSRAMDDALRRYGQN